MCQEKRPDSLRRYFMATCPEVGPGKAQSGKPRGRDLDSSLAWPLRNPLIGPNLKIGAHLWISIGLYFSSLEGLAQK